MHSTDDWKETRFARAPIWKQLNGGISQARQKFNPGLLLPNCRDRLKFLRHILDAREGFQ